MFSHFWGIVVHTRKENTMRSKTDAQRWVEKAKQFYKSSGQRIALAEFTNPNGAFVEDEMYLFVLGCKGTMLAHGINEKYVGEEFIDLKDTDGKLFIKEIVETANAHGSGWVTYKWHHPLVKRWLSKTVYFEKIDEMIICSGVYEHTAMVSEEKQSVSAGPRRSSPNPVSHTHRDPEDVPHILDYPQKHHHQKG